MTDAKRVMNSGITCCLLLSEKHVSRLHIEADNLATLEMTGLSPESYQWLKLRFQVSFLDASISMPAERSPKLSAAMDTFVRLVVLPYFERFSDPGVLISDLGQREIPAFEIASSVEFAWCFGTKKEARHVLDRFVMERRDLWEQIEQATLALREQGHIR